MTRKLTDIPVSCTNPLPSPLPPFESVRALPIPDHERNRCIIDPTNDQNSLRHCAPSEFDIRGRRPKRASRVENASLISAAPSTTSQKPVHTHPVHTHPVHESNRPLKSSSQEANTIHPQGDSILKPGHSRSLSAFPKLPSRDKATQSSSQIHLKYNPLGEHSNLSQSQKYKIVLRPASKFSGTPLFSPRPQPNRTYTFQPLSQPQLYIKILSPIKEESPPSSAKPDLRISIELSLSSSTGRETSSLTEQLAAELETKLVPQAQFPSRNSPEGAGEWNHITISVCPGSGWVIAPPTPPPPPPPPPPDPGSSHPCSWLLHPSHGSRIGKRSVAPRRWQQQERDRLRVVEWRRRVLSQVHSGKVWDWLAEGKEAEREVGDGLWEESRDEGADDSSDEEIMAMYWGWEDMDVEMGSYRSIPEEKREEDDTTLSE